MTHTRMDISFYVTSSQVGKENSMEGNKCDILQEDVKKRSLKDVLSVSNTCTIVSSVISEKVVYCRHHHTITEHINKMS